MAVPLRARARRTLRSHAIRALARLVSLLPLPIALRVGAAAGALALRFRAPLLVGTIHRKGPRPTDGHLLELTEIPYDSTPADREAEVIRITAACQAVLEGTIRRFPAEWVWMHERWKTRPGEKTAGKIPESRAVGAAPNRPF